MLEAKNIDEPDEKYTFEHGEVQLVNLTGMSLGRATFRPGWRWSTDVKPIVGTDSCQEAHSGYVVSGRFHVRMDDGTELELGPGDAHVASAGHDAWVVGDEPCVTIDFSSTGTLVGGHAVRCPCGVELRVADDHQIDHLVAAVQEHARASHDHEFTREQVLTEIGAGSAAAQINQADDVRDVINTYAQRLATGDVEGIVDLYTPHATVMAPGLATASGTDAIAATYSAALEACGMDYTFAFDTIDVRGDTAVALTRTTGATTVRATADRIPGSNRELFVLRRDRDRWRIDQYMFQPQPAQP